MLLFWCLSMIQAFSISFSVKEVFHLFVDLKQAIVFVSGRISPQVLRCLHKPTTFISFLCLFFNNSVLFIAFFHFYRRHCDIALFEPIFLFCQDHLLSLFILLTGVLSEIFLTPCAILSLATEAVCC